jgi:predicted acetylornithine/succinylornithine family transaminase
MKNRQLLALTQTHVANTYSRFPIALIRGRGCWVWDADGRRYLDFVAGIAVNNLGHAHPGVVRAIQRQSKRLIHASNLYHTAPQAELAAALCKNSFADRVFFCNSGAEANEAAFKLVRRYGLERGGRYEILSALNSFHGRTLATLTATGQEKIRAGFDPLPEGFRQAPYNDLSAMEAAVGAKTAAILVEPIQGEGGVILPQEGYLRGLRELCNAKGLLLVFDEVQTGMGRTGKLFAYEHSGVEPDVMTLAKALGGGLPLGAMLAKDEVARSLTPGSHASTFGGNPVSCSAGLAVLKALTRDGVLENCAQMGKLLLDGLHSLKASFPVIRHVRGRGLLLGMELDMEAAKIVEDCLTSGLLINGTANRVLRLLPPLTVNAKEIERALDILAKALARR